MNVRGSLVAVALLTASALAADDSGSVRADLQSLSPVQTRNVVEHVRLAVEKEYSVVTNAFMSRLGRFDQNVLKDALERSDNAEARAAIDRLAGSSGLMLFETRDHGALLRLVGQKRRAVQYVIGHPLTALAMTEHAIGASLYAPIRVLIYEDSDGKTCIEYDRPSSLIEQFRNPDATRTAVALDRQLEMLIIAATR